MILTSCSNSSAETPDNNINKIQLSNKYNDSSKTNIVQNTKEGTLSLSTTVNVNTGTSVNSIVEALKDSNKAKENFIKLLNNSEATHNGFSSNNNTIPFSDIIIQSFLSNDITITAEALTTSTNSISVTVTNSNKSWDIEGLNNIKFTLSIVEKANVDEKLIKLFSDNNEASKLVASDSTNNQIILTGFLNPDYEFDNQNNQELNSLGHKTVDEIKKWLSGQNSNDSQSTNLADGKLIELFYNNVITGNLTNKKPATEGSKQAGDIIVKKDNVLPHSILSSNTTTTFNVKDNTSQQNSNSKITETFNSKIVTITFELKEGYKWIGLDESLNKHKIVFELTIPSPVLEDITLFSNWNESFKANGEEFVFENNIDQNYQPIAWKTKNEVQTWFQKKSNTSFNTDGEVELEESSFVKLFYEPALLGDFTNVQPTGNYQSQAVKLSKEDIVPHEIDDKIVTAKVKVEDVAKPTKSVYANENYGGSKKITITLKPKKGYGWAGINDPSNKRKAIKFILNVDLSQAVLPINNILGIIKPYKNTNGTKGQDIYWFESSSNDLTFKYKNASESIQKLVTKSIFAGPEKVNKVKEAVTEISTTGFTEFKWAEHIPSGSTADNFEPIKTKKETYVNDNFELSNPENFKLFSDLVLSQSFKNRYADNDLSAANIFVPGKELWYENSGSNNVNATSTGRQVKCSVMVSISEEQSTNLVNKKLAKYDISFRLTPRNGGNWKGAEHNNPIDIDVSFVTPNFNTIKKNNEKPATPETKETEKPSLPFMTREGDAATINFNGTIATNILGDSANTTTITNETDIAKKFSTDGNNQNSPTIEAAKIKTDIVSKIEQNITSKELINNNGDADATENNTFKITKENLSFLYVDKITKQESGQTSKNKDASNTSYIYDKNINLHQIKISPVASAGNSEKANDPKKYTIDLTFKLNANNKAKWFWGNWGEMLLENYDTLPEANKDIHLLLEISIPAATTPPTQTFLTTKNNN